MAQFRAALLYIPGRRERTVLIKNVMATTSVDKGGEVKQEFMKETHTRSLGRPAPEETGLLAYSTAIVRK